MIIRASQRRRAFSLTEVLLAIFILGIGVIAVAALFPAGIAQQRQSVDDVIGPIVANNALSVLRLKLEPDDFGTFEEFGVAAPMPTIEGDWPWLRPGIDPDGWYDVFSDGTLSVSLATEFAGGYTDQWGISSSPALLGLPYNMNKWPAHPDKPPVILISRGERYYPTAHDAAIADPNVAKPKPQYVWDCMFRRFQGKILVAIFVYRVQLVGGDTVTYGVPLSPSWPGPPIPHRRMLVDKYVSPADPDAAWDVDGDLSTPEIEPIIPGTDPGRPLNLGADDWDQHWQAGRQWLLDQNNNIHRVLSGRRTVSDGPVELVRAIPEIPLLGPSSDPYWMPYFIYAPENVGMQGSENVVAAIWYIPAEVDLAAGLQAQLTPVYVTVREL
jgi:prepilin-type N-terminal cleavage/methylation domain-containing protein